MIKLVFYFLMLVCPILLDAQSDTLFEKHTFQHEQFTLPYRLLKPANYDDKKMYPIVVFLHGAGERGDNNEGTFQHIQELFLDNNNREKYPCFVLIPQCPKDQKWANLDWKLTKHTQDKNPSAPMAALIALLNEFEKNYRINPFQRYLMGLSMGGYGTWDLLARKPKYFAAGVPVCGGGDVNTAQMLKKVPIWAFHGAKDNVVPVENSRSMVEAVQQAGGKNIRYTEYPNEKHGSWIPAFKEPKLLEWLFAQQRGTIIK